MVSPYNAALPVSADGTIGIGQVMLEDFGPEVDPELVLHIIELADEASALEGVEVNVGGPTVISRLRKDTVFDDLPPARRPTCIEH